MPEHRGKGSSARRYLTVVQDARGYPPLGELDPAPPEGPQPPVMHTVVMLEDYEPVEQERDLYRAELEEAHSWMLAQGWCDCEYFEGIGTKPCRFAEALEGDGPLHGTQGKDQR